ARGKRAPDALAARRYAGRLHTELRDIARLSKRPANLCEHTFPMTSQGSAYGRFQRASITATRPLMATLRVHRAYAPRRKSCFLYAHSYAHPLDQASNVATTEHGSSHNPCSRAGFSDAGGEIRPRTGRGPAGF